MLEKSAKPSRTPQTATREKRAIFSLGDITGLKNAAVRKRGSSPSPEQGQGETRKLSQKKKQQAITIKEGGSFRELRMD